MKAITCREAGLAGAKVRHNKTPEEESRIAKKAAVTRLKKDPESFVKMGRLGAKVTHATPEKSSASARKAVATKKKKDPDFFKRIGKIGANKRKALRKAWLKKRAKLVNGE